VTFRGDDRGASVQIGAVLLFAILILAVSLWQAQVVPQQNASVEYTHNQRVVDDMKDVRSVMVSAPGERTLRSVSVDMAPAYPPRSVFVNPGPPSGTLRTVGTSNASLNVTVTNAKANDEETADFWNGSPNRYNTGGVVYEPGYNVYTSAPDTVYENTVLYNVQDDGTAVNVSGQDVVDGRTITLVVLQGNLSRTTSAAYSVDFEALSTSDTVVTVTNETGGNITVSFASRRGEGWWTAALRDSEEFADQQGNVTDVRAAPLGDGFYNVTIELEGNETYELRMAKVGVGSGADEPGTAYAVDVSGDGTTVQQGNTQQLVVEVRDAYNNPVSGVTVANNTTGSDLQGGSLDAQRRTTDGDGRVTFEYTAPSSGTGTANVTFNISDDATVAGRELVNFSVTVAGSGGGGGGGGAYKTTWADPSGQSGVTCPSGPDGVCTVDATQTPDVTLIMQTSPVADGASVDYAVNDTSIATISPKTGETNATGENKTTLTTLNDGFVKVYTTSGADGDTIELKLINTVSDLVYNGDANANDGPDTDSIPGGVTLSFTNKFGQNLTVTEIKVNNTPGKVYALADRELPNDEPKSTELYADADLTDGWVDLDPGTVLPNTFDMDTDGFNNNGNPLISAGGDMTVYLYEFEKNNGDRVNMNGESFTITVFYELEDGTTGEKTVSVTA
jgi:hypothetical protein